MQATVQRDVLGPVGADVQERSRGLADGAEVLHPLVSKAEERGDALGVETGGSRDVLLEGVRLRGDREEVEDPAAGVVDEDDGEPQFQALGTE